MYKPPMSSGVEELMKRKVQQNQVCDKCGIYGFCTDDGNNAYCHDCEVEN